MISKTFVIATSRVNARNEKINCGNATSKKHVQVLLNFNRSLPVGGGTITVSPNDIKLTCSLSEDFVGLYPEAIYHILQSHMEGNIKVLDKIKIMAVALNKFPGIDGGVQPL